MVWFVKKLSIAIVGIVMLSSCSYPVFNTVNLDTDATDPIIIVQISDLHYVSGHNIYTTIVEKINVTAPDAFVITGDLIDKQEELPALISCLGTISIQCPKFAILGNWKYWCKVNREVLLS